MNKNEKQMIARLDERTKSMHDTLKEIKQSLSRIKGCIADVETKSIKTEQRLNDHMKSHDIGRSWVQFIPSAVAVVVSIVAVFIAFS